MGTISDFILRLFTRQHWFLAYRSASDASGGFRFVVPPGGHFYADPFLFQRGGKNYIFAEDYRLSERKAVISVAKLGMTGECGPWHECLARPYHLSYPCVFAWQGEVYMLPETRGNRAVELYRADEFPLRWKLEKTLLSDIEVVDATVTQIKGRWWMFAAVAGDGRGTNDNLHLYHADSPLGPWTPHIKNPVVIGKAHSRPAGMVFEADGMLVRPAQDCELRYGHRVVFHRIDELTPEAYKETAIGSIEPDWLDGNLGTHTYQIAAGFEAVDARFRVLRGPFEPRMHFQQKPWPWAKPWSQGK